jgi:hypothetical protein
MASSEKLVNILGKRVAEDSLKGPLKDLIGKRGLKATLLLEREMSGAELEKSLLMDEPDGGYANVYKYAFF